MLIDYGRKNSKQIQDARNESWEKESEPKREVRGDADELTETRRSQRQQATRWREKAKPTGRRCRAVGEMAGPVGRIANRTKTLEE